VSAALKKQAHYIPKVKVLSKTDGWVQWRTGAETAAAQQQKRAQHPQINIHTGSRHSSGTHKQHKLIFQPQLAL
jgi:hypothetical protein